VAAQQAKMQELQAELDKMQAELKQSYDAGYHYEATVSTQVRPFALQQLAEHCICWRATALA
jgi:membrane protein insertase Oxa1/YidC/SpoIIIJ